MADPKLPGVEMIGRVVGLEAFVLAMASELLTTKSDGDVAAIFAHIKGMAQDLVDAVTPSAGPVSPLVKQLEQYAMSYVEQHIETITRQRRKALDKQ